MFMDTSPADRFWLACCDCSSFVWNCFSCVLMDLRDNVQVEKKEAKEDRGWALKLRGMLIKIKQ